MLIDLKTYHLYQYFKLIKTKSLPEEKKPQKPSSGRFPGIHSSLFVRRKKAPK